MAKAKVELVAELNAPGGGAWQGAVHDDVTGEWFMAHSLGSGDGKIHRFGISDKIRKPYLDTMILKDHTHVYGFGVRDRLIWTGWDDQAEGNDIVTIPYKGGKTVRKSAAKELHVFTDEPSQVSMSVTGTRLAIMETLDNNTVYQFTKRRTADVLANKDEALGKVIRVPHGDSDEQWLQGFTLAGDFLYLCWGRTNEKAWIDKYSFTTGKKVGSVDITSAGYLPGEVKDNREPEGMDGHTFGVKVHEGSERVLRIYKLINF